MNRPVALSAVDLARFAACPHAMMLDLQAGPTRRDDAPWRMIAAPGGGHEVLIDDFDHAPGGREVIRLVLASRALGQRQGMMPVTGHLQPKGGDPLALPIADVCHWVDAVQARAERLVAEQAPTRPLPCAECPTCRWADDCRARWQAEDSLHRIVRANRGAIARLEDAGITTVAALAELDSPPPGMARSVMERLRTEARLHLAADTGGQRHALRAAEPGRGFDRLPRPDPGDIFVLIGDDDGQIMAMAGPDGIRVMTADPAAGMALLIGSLQAGTTGHPGAHVHLADRRSLAALRNLATRHGTGEGLVDQLLRQGRLVDLGSILSGAVDGRPPVGIDDDGSEPDSTPLALASAAAGDLQMLCTRRLQQLQALRDWLVAIRPAHLSWPEAAEPPTVDAATDPDEDALHAMLADTDIPADHRRMLLDLGLFHRREQRPGQWAVFDSLAREGDALLDDLDALGGLVALGPAEPLKRSFIRHYRFPPQDSKLRAGRRATIAGPDGTPVGIAIEEMDRRSCRITIKAGPGKAHLLRDRLNLHPDWPLDAGVIADALRDVIADQCGARDWQAVDDLLARRPPRLTGSLPDPVTDTVADTVAAVLAMDRTVLPIQGPPGTGKTHVTARAIVALLQQGARVGVSSNSHEAIRNLLEGCIRAAGEAGITPLPQVVHKTSGPDDGYAPDSRVLRTTSNEEAARATALVGATAWFFARPENIQAFDWLFVDEAGQVGLANMAAMGRAARNIVLVGDPCQLPQVIQGAHPAPANLSCFEWMLGDAATIPPDRGIFLDTSRRMHPDLCGYISRQIYAGRLLSHPDTATQAVRGSSWPECGAWWVPVPHRGHAQVAPEEVAAIAHAAADLLGVTWTGREGTTRPFQPADIIVVAPYNAQVNALREALPTGIRVGTVDSFQGQEAPVCLISMTASSVEESARGMEFLLSRNRINVAVSRAKALALVFGAPALRAARGDTIERIRLINTLCALPEWRART